MRVRVALLGMIVLAGLLVAACSDLNEPVVERRLPPAPDTGFVTYRHPSGVFSIRIPPDWQPQDLPDPNGVRVQFAALRGGQVTTWLSVYVVNTGEPLTPEAFAQKVDTYIPPADLAGYEWQELERAAQLDLSQRIVGVRTYPLTGPRELNIFLQNDGAFFSALEVDLTEADAATLNTLRAVTNTFRVDQRAELLVGAVQQASSVTSQSGIVGFNGYHTWTDADGIFHITGEAVNTSRYPIEALVLTGYLFDAQGRQLDEQSDVLRVDVLKPCAATPCMPGEGAPFDLRFLGGKPAGTVRFELHVAAREADFMLRTFYGPENFRIIKDPPVYNDQGELLVRGELANIGPRAASAVKVIVAIWDDQGRIVATETIFIPREQIVPQESVRFEVPISVMGGAAVQYTWQVMGSVAS